MPRGQPPSVTTPSHNPSSSSSSSSSIFSGLNYGDLIAAGGEILAGQNDFTTAGENAGAAARNISFQNASEMLALAGQNAARSMDIAGINAAATRNIYYSNAGAVESTALRNGQLMMIEGAEKLRRHVRLEQYLVGDLRARQAATGWSVNEGVLVIYKEAEKDEMLRERKFIALQEELSLFTMLANAGEQGRVLRQTGDQLSNAMLASASIEREIMLSEAQALYSRMRREGELYFLQGQQYGQGLDAQSGGGGLSVLGGAATGARIGSAFGPVGTGVGAVVGGIAGAIF